MRIWILAGALLGAVLMLPVSPVEAGDRGAKTYSNGTGLNARV